MSVKLSKILKLKMSCTDFEKSKTDMIYFNAEK